MLIKFEGGSLDGQERPSVRLDPIVRFVVVPPIPADAAPVDRVQYRVEHYQLTKYTSGGRPTEWIEVYGPYTSRMVQVPNPDYQEEWRYVLME